MRTVVGFAGAVLLLVVTALRAPAQECANVTGCWEGSYTNSVSGAFESYFEQEQSSVSGALILHDTRFGTLPGTLAGTATCDTLEFESFFFTPVFFTVTFSAQIIGDCMAGTFSVPILSTNGTWQACRAACCGNGSFQPGETCDDGNTSAGDGCSDTCMVEPGWFCFSQPSICTQIVCGDGVVHPGEACDDGNTASGDGCSASCAVEAGYTCAGSPSICLPIECGNGVVQPGEQCDDGNTAGGDCCGPECTAEPAGTACSTPNVVGTCDASGHCIGAAIPTLSEWGIALLSLLMLAVVLARRRPATRVSGC